MVRIDPAPHVTAVVGAVIVTGGTMLKFTALTPWTALFRTQVTRTRAALVIGRVTSQLNVPDVFAVSGTFEAIFVQVVPPSPLRSIWTDSAAPRLWLDRKE